MWVVPWAAIQVFPLLGSRSHRVHCTMVSNRIHKTLRVTPAMEAGISDHVWSIEEVATLLEVNVKPSKRGPYQKKSA